MFVAVRSFSRKPRDEEASILRVGPTKISFLHQRKGIRAAHELEDLFRRELHKEAFGNALGNRGRCLKRGKANSQILSKSIHVGFEAITGTHSLAKRPTMARRGCSIGLRYKRMKTRPSETCTTILRRLLSWNEDPARCRRASLSFDVRTNQERSYEMGSQSTLPSRSYERQEFLKKLSHTNVPEKKKRRTIHVPAKTRIGGKEFALRKEIFPPLLHPSVGIWSVEKGSRVSICSTKDSKT